MATDPDTTQTSKSTTPKRTAAKGAATAKPVPAKRRRAARTKTTAARPASTATGSRGVPQWLTVGASVTGAAVAIGATLFATRQEWLPRARQFGDWVEKSVHDQLDTLTARRAKGKTPDASDIPVAAPHYDAGGADAGFAAT